MFRKVLSCILILSIAIGVFSPFSSVYAAATDDFKTFTQGSDPWGSYPYAEGTDIATSGCMITAVAILMAYANPDLRDLNKFDPAKLAEKMDFDGQCIIWQSAANFDPTFTLVNYDAPFDSGNVKAEIKKVLDEGNYLVVRSDSAPITGSTHYCPIVGWDSTKNEPLIWDVNADKNSVWSTWETAGIEQFTIYHSSISKSLDVLGKDTGNGKALPEATSEEKAKQQAIVAEWDLTGMPLQSSLSGKVDLAKEDSLSKTEKKNMLAIKDNIKTKESSWLGIANSLVIMLGLVVIIYGVLLGVFFIFDKTNIIFDFSLLSVLTFGKYRVWDEIYGVPVGLHESSGIVYCDGSYLVKKLIIIEFIGFLTVGGGVFDVVYTIMNTFSGLLMR